MKRLCTMVSSLLLLALLALPAVAAELGRPNITPEMTMKEIRANPSIAGSGISTYRAGDGDNLCIRQKTDKLTLEQLLSIWMGKTAGKNLAKDCAAGLNLAIETYNAGEQVTWQVYSPEEIAANASLGGVQLYYYPSGKPNSRYAVVLGGNALEWSGELMEGISTASQLHEMGYTVFVLRYSIGLDRENNNPLIDLGRAVQRITANADRFDVQPENYALIGYSSGGHLCGLFASEKEYGYHAYGVPKPGALILAYSVMDFAEIKPTYHILYDPDTLDWRYYWETLPQAVTDAYPPTYFWYGDNDIFVMATGYWPQAPAMKQALEAHHVPYQMQTYRNAAHGVGPGRGTDAEGWLKDAVAFWEAHTPQ